MPPKTGQDALALVMKHPEKVKDLGDGKKNSALEEAASRISALTNRIANAKDKMEVIGEVVLSTFAMQATNLVGSIAEGYWGSDKMDVMGVDVRAGLGALAGTWGLYSAWKGDKTAVYKMAVANGLFAPAIGRLGRYAGAKLASPATPTNTPASTDKPAAPPAAEGELGARRQLREMLNKQMLDVPAAPGRAVPVRREPTNFNRGHAAAS